jgi:cobalt-zinc-cadmium resistance protein CzcA
VPVDFASDTVENHPSLKLQEQNIAIAKAETKVQQQAYKPGFDGRFFSQKLYGIGDPFSGFSVSMNFPLFGRGSTKKRVQAARLEQSYQETLRQNQLLQLNTAYQRALQDLKKDEELLNYYETTGLSQAEEILKASNIAYRAGEISFADMSQFLSQAIDIRRNHLDILNQYNQSAIQLNYFVNSDFK